MPLTRRLDKLSLWHLFKERKVGFVKTQIIKIIFAIAIAGLTGAGYYVYASPEQGKTGYIALEEIPAGQVIEAEKLAFVELMTENTDYVVMAPEEVVGKVTDVTIHKGELVNPSMLRDEEADENVRYYTVDLSYVEANGPVLKKGLKVDIWSSATELEEAKQVLQGVRIYDIVPHVQSDAGTMVPNQNASIVFEMNEDQIKVIESAKRNSKLFLVVRGVELR